MGYMFEDDGTGYGYYTIMGDDFEMCFEGTFQEVIREAEAQARMIGMPLKVVDEIGIPVLTVS